MLGVNTSALQLRTKARRREEGSEIIKTSKVGLAKFKVSLRDLKADCVTVIRSLQKASKTHQGDRFLPGSSQ